MRKVIVECIKDYFEYQKECIYNFEETSTNLMRCKETGELFAKEKFNKHFKEVK